MGLETKELGVGNAANATLGRKSKILQKNSRSSGRKIQNLEEFEILQENARQPAMTRRIHVSDVATFGEGWPHNLWAYKLYRKIRRMTPNET